MPVKNLRNGTLKIYDGTPGTPNWLEVAFSSGDLSWKQAHPKQIIYDRGRLAEFLDGKEEVITGTFSKMFEEFIKQTGSPYPTVYEALTRTGAAATWVTTSSDNCGVYTVKFVFDIADNCGGRQSERITFNKVWYDDISFSEAEESNKESYSFSDLETAPTIAKF